MAKAVTRYAGDPVATRLDDELSNACQQGRADAQAALDEDRYLDLLDEIDRFVASSPVTDLAGRPARSVVPKLDRHNWRRLNNSHRPS